MWVTNCMTILFEFKLQNSFIHHENDKKPNKKRAASAVFKYQLYSSHLGFCSFALRLSLFLKSNGSESLLLLFTKRALKAIRSYCSLQDEQKECFARERAICSILSKSERFARKTKEQIPNPEKMRSSSKIKPYFLKSL